MLGGANHNSSGWNQGGGQGAFGSIPGGNNGFGFTQANNVLIAGFYDVYFTSQWRNHKYMNSEQDIYNNIVILQLNRDGSTVKFSRNLPVPTGSKTTSQGSIDQELLYIGNKSILAKPFGEISLKYGIDTVLNDDQLKGIYAYLSARWEINEIDTDGDGLTDEVIGLSNPLDETDYPLAPEISGTPSISIDEEVDYTFTPIVSDSNSNDTHFEFSIQNKPSWAAFSTSNGTLSGSTDTDAEGGTYSNIIISVSDGVLTTSLPAFSITVNNINDYPIISGDTPSASILEDNLYTYIPTGSDEESSIVFSILNKPSWATFDETTGELSGYPDGVDVQLWEDIVISVNDGDLTSSLPTFSILVYEFNDVPIINSDTYIMAYEDQAFDYTVSITDEESNDFNFTVENIPTWASVTTTNSEIVFTGSPTNELIGIYDDIYISVIDQSIER